VVSLVDNAHNPVPFASLVLSYRRYSDTLHSDSTGTLQLPITQELMKGNPKITAFGGTKPVYVEMQLLGTSDFSAKPQVVDPDSFLWRVGDSVAVLYRLASSNLVDSVLSILAEQRSYIVSRLPVKAIPWAVVLVDTDAPFMLARGTATEHGVRYHLYPYSVSGWRASLYRDNFWRFTKNCLFEAVPDTSYTSEDWAQWVFTGLASFWNYQHFLSAGQPAQKTFGVGLRSDSEWPFVESLVHRQVKPLNLLYWKPSSESDWFILPEFTRAFWMKIHDDYGDSAIGRFVTEAGQSSKSTPEKLADILVKQTGPEAKKLLTAFPPKLALDAMERVRKETSPQ
jgi:hypothetical protein